MSPQRLGGSGSRSIGVSKCISVSARISTVAIKGASGCLQETKKPISICPVQTESIFIGLGAAVDPAGYFCRWSGVESHPLRLSADPHHGVLFWRQKRPRQARIDRTRYLLHRGTGADQLVAGCCRSPYRRVNRCTASKSAGADCHSSYIGCLCHEPFRVLGAQASLLADPGGRQILHGIFWIFFHGDNPGCGGRTLHRPLRAGASDLGCNTG